MTLWNGLRDLPSTNFRIFVSVLLEAVFIVTVLAGMVLNRAINIEVVWALGIIITGWLGLGVAQFTSKRFSDTEYVAAKNATAQPNITVEQNASPSTMTVERPAVAAPAPDAAMPLRAMIPKARATPAPSVKPLTHREREAD